MTYNQIRNRIKKICLNHLQVRSFHFGKYEDYVDSKDFSFACIIVQDLAGSVSTSNHQISFGFRFLFLDRTFIATNADENEADVISDCYSIAADIIAQLSYPGFNDWKISGTNTAQPLSDFTSDYTAGCYVDLSISTIYNQNTCAVPSSLILTPEDMSKETFDTVYIAPEDIADNTFEYEAPLEVQNKKILLLIRENNPLYKTTADIVKSSEYKFNGTLITYGTPLEPEERTIILYRNF